MQALSPHHRSWLLVMLFALGAVLWGASLTAAPQEPAPSTGVPLVWHGKLYSCSPVDPASVIHADAEESNGEADATAAAKHRYRELVYYDDAAHTHSVGTGTFWCSGRATFQGKRTPFFDVLDDEPCCGDYTC